MTNVPAVAVYGGMMSTALAQTMAPVDIVRPSFLIGRIVKQVAGLLHLEMNGAVFGLLHVVGWMTDGNG